MPPPFSSISDFLYFPVPDFVSLRPNVSVSLCVSHLWISLFFFLAGCRWK
jgi:hypothetical protein